MADRSDSRRQVLAVAVTAALSMAAAGSCGAAPARPLSINGMWLIKPTDYGKRLNPTFTPAAAAAAEKQRKATDEQGQVLSDAAKKCMPIGMPGFMSNEFALEILETPGRVTLISENSPLVRTVYLNKKTHTADAQPGWNGHSIGHWEGKTLVIDTIGFNGRGALLGPVQKSDKTHVVEG